MNISFFTKEILRDIDSMGIKNDSICIQLQNMNYLFAERFKNGYNSRFSTKGTVADIINLIKNSNWALDVYNHNTINKFYTPKETKQKIEKLRYEIFMLF